MTSDKHFLIRLALASVAALIMTSSIASAQLMSLYQFDSNLSDTVRTNGAGTALTGPIAYVPGKVGQALNLNGSTLIRAPQAGAGLQSYTISAWVNFDTAGLWSTIVKNWGDAVPGSFHLGLNDAASTNRTISNFIGTSNGGSVTTPSVVAPSPVALDTWTHVAVTFGSGSQRLFLNGSQVATNAATGTVVNNFPFMSFGGKLNDAQTAIAPANPGWFDGWLDEVAFFNTNLTSTQITGLFNAGNAGDSVTTLGYTFDPYVDPNPPGPAPIPEPGTWAAAALLVGAARATSAGASARL